MFLANSARACAAVAEAVTAPVSMPTTASEYARMYGANSAICLPNSTMEDPPVSQLVAASMRPAPVTMSMAEASDLTPSNAEGSIPWTPSKNGWAFVMKSDRL